MPVGAGVGVGRGVLVAVGEGVSAGSGVFVGVDVGTTVVAVGVFVGAIVAVAVGSGVDVGTAAEVGDGSGVDVGIGVLVAVSITSDVGVIVGSTRTTCATVGDGPTVGSTNVGSAVSQAQTETANTKPTAITVNRVRWATNRHFMGEKRTRGIRQDSKAKTFSSTASVNYTPESGAESHPRIFAIASPIYAGDSTTVAPAASSALFFSDASPALPVIMAPACPIRLPGGAV